MPIQRNQDVGGFVLDHFMVETLPCEHLGKVTIYERGFRVVHMQDNKNTVTYVRLVIEEQ